MRLLCVYQHAPTPGAPGIYRHRLLLGELSRRGWHVDLVSTPRNYMTGGLPREYRTAYRRETIDGVEHHWVWASGGIHASRARRALNYASFAAAATARAAMLPRPDVILASSPPLSIGAVGETLSARFRRPWVLEIRDPWPESAVSVGWLSRDSALYGALDRLADRYHQRAAAVVVTSPGLEPIARRRGAGDVEVVPGSVVETRVDSKTRERVRRELGVDDGTCLFLYLGAHGIANGLGLLLDAVSRVDVPAAFVLAGDGSERAALETRVRSEGLDGVRLLGPVSRERVDELLAASDVGLHLLRADALFSYPVPTKIVEYLGAGRPFVTTVPGVPEQLARESGGGVAPTAEELAAELRRWAGLPADERARLGEAARRYGVERFGLEANADRLESVLRRALEAR